MSNKKDIKFPERTRRAEDAKPEQPAAPVESSTLATVQPDGQVKEPEKKFQIVPFDDGVPLRFQQNPRKAGQYVLFDRTRMPLAVTNHGAMAEMLCTAAAHLFFAQAEAAKRQEEELAKATDDGDLDHTQPLPGNVEVLDKPADENKQ